jgi:acetylcholinesterase
MAPGLSSYKSLQVAFGPSVDGKVIVRNPQASIKKGLYARVPIITGNVDDEGTLFSFGNQNITSVLPSAVHQIFYLPILAPMLSSENTSIGSEWLRLFLLCL